MIDRKEQHNNIYNQLVYELFCDPLPKMRKNTAYKSEITLSKRAKFNQKMREQAKTDPGII